MVEFEEILARYENDVKGVESWCQKEYEDHFSSYFSEMNNLYSRMQSAYNPITDEELEMILTDIPLQLFGASEALSAFKAGIEVIKLRIKQVKHNNLTSSEATSQKARTEEAAYSVIEDELLLKIYGVVVDRVERQITFSKELIMSAKKIWTARRETESVAVAADSTELPDYISLDKKYYIEG